MFTTKRQPYITVSELYLNLVDFCIWPFNLLEEVVQFNNGTTRCNIPNLALTLDPNKKSDETYSFYRFSVSTDMNKFNVEHYNDNYALP